ncbi:GAF domain-containing protein [Labilibacter sediminis]|nr:GAF domain-containing protein [Labilibacter sediminis]
MEKTEEMKISCTLKKAPFKTSLSFEYLISEIEKISDSQNHPLRGAANDILNKVNAVPKLKTVITDKVIIKENQTLVNHLMGFLFNPLNDKVEISAAFPPFEMSTLYSTSKFKEVIAGEHRSLEIAKDIANDKALISLLYHAYLIILEKIYDFNIILDMPKTLKLTDELDKSIKFFQTKVDTSYLRVKPIGNYKKLTKDELKELFDKDNDLDFWYEKIPLDKFEFTGFLKFNYVDITYDYVISQLKSDLLDKYSIISEEGFGKIRQKIRALLENPHVEFGLAATNNFETRLSENMIWKTIVPLSVLDCNDYKGTVYEKAYKEQRIVITQDFEKLERNKVVDAYLQKGIRSHAIVPLVLEDKVIGMLEFGCKHPGAISMLQMKRLYELFPIFSLALKRSMDEWYDKLRAYIQEEFTAIHPTVEWRFHEVAGKMLNESAKGELVSIEPIVFPGIVPIYGASDIRSSSVERNIAIQSDLTEQLQHALSIIEMETSQRDIPLLNDHSYKIKKHLKTVKSGLKAGDEVSIIEFLKKEIDPLLLLLKNRFEEMKKPVDDYFKTLDDELGVLYKKRKDFEDSLTLINDKVGDIIDKEQVNAQLVFPHYFEKYRTDGIEYNGYLGQSLVKDLEYNDIYLKNIRLWQLLVQVKIAHEIRRLQPSLPTKLDITQLILVHSNPLSIEFRQDEKKFDVAGAYNIRYEITKKRIDKALIKGTRERITEVGKIAIIYSYADEIEEYKRYIDYMQAQGYITSLVEDFELEDLKGASGLKALRIEVDFSNVGINEIKQKEIEHVVNSGEL